jgi:peroxiredoxin Q/BCP
VLVVTIRGVSHHVSPTRRSDDVASTVERWPALAGGTGGAGVAADPGREVVRRIAGVALSPGDPAPDFTLLDQHEQPTTLSTFRKRRVLVYFYPKADTPGCTKQACGLNDVLGDIGDTVVLGISPDKPSKQLKFAERYSLGFPLLSDPDHAVAEAFDVWKQKSMYGRSYMGIERSAFLVDEGGKIAEAWYKVSPADTPKNLLAALA